MKIEKGVNPFDRFSLVEALKENPPRKVNTLENQAIRMAKVKALAQKQKDRTRKLLIEGIPAPAPAPPPIVASVPKPAAPPRITGRQAWFIFWAVIWVITSMAMMGENFLGAIPLVIAGFFVCAFFAQAPEIYAGVFGASGRGTNGRAV